MPLAEVVETLNREARYSRSTVDNNISKPNKNVNNSDIEP